MENEKKVENKVEGKVENKVIKKAKRVVKAGVAHIQATFNNTLVTLTDTEGKLLVQRSPVNVGFKGSRKSTAFAATKAAKEAADIAMKKYGLVEVKVYIKGPGAGRNAAVKGLDSAGLKITLLADTTPIPHNGCRPRKRPRK